MSYNLHCTCSAVKTYKFITQSKATCKSAFETANIIVFDAMICKSPEVPLQNELLC